MRKLIAFVLILLLGVAAWLAWALWLPLSPGGRTFVMLRPGYSTRRVARELKAARVIRNAEAFVFWHALHRRPSLKAGEYVFEQDASAISVHKRLARGDVYFHTVVIPEGFNMFDIAAAIQNAGLGSSREFLKVATNDTALISDLAPGATSLEGYLFPDTYEFTRTQSVHDMATEMVKKFRKVAAEIGLNQDLPRIVTLASIVEKETGVPEERPEVASVYSNRLRGRIPLQADPSVIYAELLQGAYGGALHHGDMSFNSLYNTYRYAGLPPGPIANPGRTSLEAAMHPAETQFLFFVSDGNGHHRFSNTLEEHNRNVAALRRAVARKYPQP
ncbi:MAG TPA: endolytic transglycosylase MltG [Terriglobales bacterium]|jgi:UPF0755 protein